MVASNFPSEKKALTRREAAQILAISISTLDREVSSGRIPHLRVGRRVLFRFESLVEHMKQIEIPTKR